jgi:hypothetical protein
MKGRSLIALDRLAELSVHDGVVLMPTQALVQQERGGEWVRQEPRVAQKEVEMTQGVRKSDGGQLDVST